MLTTALSCSCLSEVITLVKKIIYNFELEFFGKSFHNIINNSEEEVFTDAYLHF